MNAPDVIIQRKEWINKLPKLDKNKLVFLDESRVNIDMTRIYGRSLGGRRCVDKAPLLKPQSTTILSSVHLNGETAFTDKLVDVFDCEFVEDSYTELLCAAEQGKIIMNRYEENSPQKLK